MGRARRNQRDAIRKQRAKRRRRGSGLDNSDDSDIDTNNIDDVSIDRLDAVLAASAVAPTIVAIIDNEETKNDEPILSSSWKKKQAKKVGTNIGKKGSTTNEENDRIERMRLKKQQHKARRKEKKEARETAAAAIAIAAATLK